MTTCSPYRESGKESVVLSDREKVVFGILSADHKDFVRRALRKSATSLLHWTIIKGRISVIIRRCLFGGIDILCSSEVHSRYIDNTINFYEYYTEYAYLFSLSKEERKKVRKKIEMVKCLRKRDSEKDKIIEHMEKIRNVSEALEVVADKFPIPDNKLNLLKR